MDMDNEFAKEIVFALACAGFSAQRHEYDSVREVVYEQVKLINGFLRTPLRAGCAFVERPEAPEEGYLNAVWIGTAEHIFRVDLSNRDYQVLPHFRCKFNLTPRCPMAELGLSAVRSQLARTSAA